MVAESFEHSFSVARPAAECWDMIIDVRRVSGWVSVVADTNELAPLSRYTAVLEDRIGPIKLRADLDVDVTSIDIGSRISIHADGEDRQVGSRIVVDATVALTPHESGCGVKIDGQYEVTGRVATMGASTIRQKADKILAEFSAAARRELG